MGLPESVIAAIYLLDEKSVHEIVTGFTTAELSRSLRSPDGRPGMSSCEQSADVINQFKQFLPRFIPFNVSGLHPQSTNQV